MCGELRHHECVSERLPLVPHSDVIRHYLTPEETIVLISFNYF